jgi:GR25 family glycosyltransferase involved in LPS biosynthesis
MTKLEGYYINLENREDRRQHFEGLKTTWPFLSSINRLKAIENEDGALGCCYSHLLALTLLLSEEKGDSYGAVFEDDFFILDEPNFRGFLEGFEKVKDTLDWDIIVLTPRGTTVKPLFDGALENSRMEMAGFRRIIEHQTATGYIIKRHFIPILIKNLEEAIQGLLCGGDPNTFAIDQYWKQLQKHYGFYYYKYLYAGQLVGFSDIEKRLVNYNDRFIRQ